MTDHEALLRDAAKRLLNARGEAEQALVGAREAALSAIADGFPEAAVARALGVDRMTVRRWEGKQ